MSTKWLILAVGLIGWALWKASGWQQRNEMGARLNEDSARRRLEALCRVTDIADGRVER